MGAFIKSVSYYLPEKIFSNDDLSRLFPEWSVDKVESKIGIIQRHISEENELSSDMAVKAGQKLFEEHSINPSDIDFVLFCTQSPDYFLPTSACIIQEKLGISTASGAFDFNLGCSGYVYGLGIAKGLICGGMARNVLLLTGETYTKYIHQSDKGNRSIFGDAASATLVSTDGIAEIADFDFGTDGKGYNNLIVRNGALRNQIETEAGDPDLEGQGSANHLYMNGGEIFNFTLESVPKLINNVIEKNGAKFSDIDLFVFHQANKYMLNHLRKKLKIEEEKFYLYLEKVGNTVSSTIPIALYEACREGKISRGKKVLIAGFGVGYSWAGTVLKF